MNSSIVLKAQDFCSLHFCDNTLSMDDYMSFIDEYLNDFPQPEEKVQFLVEVKRIGNLIIENTLSQIKEKEFFGIDQNYDFISGRNLSYL